MPSKKSMLLPSGSLEYKPSNKEKRKLLHIKRKRAKDIQQRAERFGRKKEEAKDPKLKAERLRRNVPLTLERKRVWDDVDSDLEDGLGLSFDVERLKKQKLVEMAEEVEKSKFNVSATTEEGQEDDIGEDVDSMIDSNSDQEDGKPQGFASGNGLSRKARIPSTTERPACRTQSSKSTNLDLAPDALAAKFPALFPSEPPPCPKILITTSINSALHDQARILTDLLPNSVYIRRSTHRYGHKFSVREISSFASKRNYTALVVLEEDQKRVSGLTVVHLPVGPTFHFSVSNWIEGKKLPGHGNPTGHWPELILNNFRTPLGLLTAHLFRTLFPPQPELHGRQVVTLHNQRDYIFVRRHRYVFREKRETEKGVVGTDGREMKGVEEIRAALQELGPRFTLKLRRIDKGIQRQSGQEWEWKGGMERQRTKFQL
jgi:ribosome production factor 1